MNFQKLNKILRFNRHLTSCFFAKKNKSTYNFCEDTIKKNDYENYVCGLFLPPQTRKVSFALRSLNFELSNIINSVSKPEIAKIKFKYWEQEVNLLLESSNDSDVGKIGSPLIRELSQINFPNSNLCKIWINRLFIARYKMIYEIPFTSIDEAHKYFEDVNSSLLYILADHMNLSNLEIDHALSHLGKCQGLITLIRGIPILAWHRQKVIIPNDLMVEHRLSQSDLLRCISSKKLDDSRLKDLIYNLASLANEQADTTLSIYSKIKNKSSLLRKLCAPIIPAKRYLEKLRIADFNVIDYRLNQSDHMLAFHIYWRILVKRMLL